ncbi:MAG: L,D-transpeptidase [Gemmatimonadaceae bacterium]
MNRSLKKSILLMVVASGAAGIAGMRASASTSAVRREAPARIVADLSDKILYLYDGDSIGEMYDIADGTVEYPTPKGAFNIRKLTWNPSWTPPDSKWAKTKTAKEPGHPQNPMKVVKIFFKEPDYYIHGTADIASLGSADSHGCLRMAPEDVMKVGRWVMDHGGQPHEENWFKRILHSRSEEKLIYLAEPVSMTVQD